MPSIQDVADQINARLDQVATNTAETAQNTAENVNVSKDIRNELIQSNARLSQIDNTLNLGFANISQGIFSLVQLQLVELALLDHHRKQNDVIICELVNNNNLLCNIKRKLGHLLQHSEKSLASTERIEGIVERVFCNESSDYDRKLEMMKKLEECCPPERPRKEKCPPDCKAPDYKKLKPEGLDWKPLPNPKQPEPVG